MEGGVELVVGRLPDEDLVVAGTDDPGTEDGEGVDVVFVVDGHFQLSDLLASLEDPDTAFRLLRLTTPCCEDQILVGYACSDEFGSLRASDEDEVETAAQIVGLQTATNRGGELEGCLAEGDAGEGDGGGRYETDSLRKRKESATQREGAVVREVGTLYGAKSREEPGCL